MHEVKFEPADTADNFEAGNALSGDAWQALKNAFTAASSIAFVFSETLLQSEVTADAARALIQLALFAGRPEASHGASLYPLSGEINSAGALLMGVSSNRLPGFLHLSDDHGRKRCSEIWQAKGLKQNSWPSLEEALKQRQIKALFVQEAALLWEKDAEYWDNLLSSVEFLVLQENVASPALDRAHVVLPLAAFGEQPGTVINLERRVLGLKQAFAPQGESRGDWETLSQIIATQGLPCPMDLSAIHGEIEKTIPELSDLTVSGFEDL